MSTPSNPMFLLQIVYPDGTVVKFPAGGPLEAALVEAISVAALKRMSILDTTPRRRKAIKEAIEEVFLALKTKTLWAF